MKATIDISNIVAQLEAVRSAVHPHEFSGFGFVEPGTDANGETNFMISKWFLLDVGSAVLTTISIPDQIRLKDHPDIKFMRCWIHAHPVGNGNPGPHCWSGTDENAIATSPMGTVPALMDWMISIVRTPGGWVGRFDNPGKNTYHLEVVPSFRNDILTARDLVRAYNGQRYERAEAFGLLEPVDAISAEDYVQQSFLGSAEDTAEFYEDMTQFGDPDDNYWAKEKERIHGRQSHTKVSRLVRSEQPERKDYREWWAGFLDDDGASKDGSNS